MLVGVAIGALIGALGMAFYLKSVGGHKRMIDMLRGSEPQDG